MTSDSVQIDLMYKGRCPAIKEQIVYMALNSRGIRDTARVLKISPTTVMNALNKKEATLSSVHRRRLVLVNPDEVPVVLRLAGAAAVDERWSFVGKQQAPRWRGPALEHCRGHVLAYVFGRRQDAVFLKPKALLELLSIIRYYTDYWGTSMRHLDADAHQPGKRNPQQRERMPLMLRTRIKRLMRKTICFSKSIQVHDSVIELFVNRYEWGLWV